MPLSTRPDLRTDRIGAANDDGLGPERGPAGDNAAGAGARPGGRRRG